MTTKRTVVRVPIKTNIELSRIAEERGITKNGLINYIIAEFLNKKKGEKQ